jgi:hypothetical protein
VPRPVYARLRLEAHGETLVHHSRLLEFREQGCRLHPREAKHRHLDYLFEEIIVPTEKLVDVRHRQKHTTERKFFPGYVLAKMELTDEAYSPH